MSDPLFHLVRNPELFPLNCGLVRVEGSRNQRLRTCKKQKTIRVNGIALFFDNQLRLTRVQRAKIDATVLARLDQKDKTTTIREEVRPAMRSVTTIVIELCYRYRFTARRLYPVQDTVLGWSEEDVAILVPASPLTVHRIAQNAGQAA